MHRDGTYLGVDPGPKSGGAAVVSSEGGTLRLVSWAAWTRGRAGTPYTLTTPAEESTHATAADVRSDFGASWAWTIDAAAVEAPLAGGRVRGAQLIALAEDAGAWADLAHRMAGPPLRPRPDQWRREIGSHNGAGCDALVRGLLAQRWGLPVGGLDGHVVDAVGLAVYAAVTRPS